MDLNFRNRIERPAALRSAAAVACALALSASSAVAQDRSTQVRIAQEQQRQADAPAGWFGVTVNDNGTIDDEGNPFYNGYPMVTTVESGSPAAKAGVKAGDILIAFNDHDMKGSAMALRDWLQPGSTFVVKLRRDGAARQVRGTIGKRPAGFDRKVTLIWTTEGSENASGINGATGSGGPISVRVRAPMPTKLPPVLVGSFSFGGGVYPFQGAEFTALNPDLSEALGVGKEGVFVTNVIDGSPARLAGLRGGDVVLTADSIRLEDPMSLVRAIRESDDHSIRLGIVRKKKAQTVLLKW